MVTRISASIAEGSRRDLPAPDASAVPALRGKPVLGQLPEVGMPGPGHDQFGRDVALHPREPRVLRYKCFYVRYKIDEILLIVRSIPPEFPEFLDLGARGDKRRVDL